MTALRSAAAFCVAVSCALWTSALHAQNTIHVPADRSSIQAGIDAAVNGDTVMIAPGTYYENIDFKGKAITVTSSTGASTTVVDGSGKGPTVTFKSGEPRAAVLSNLTITHGGTIGQYNYSGDGIAIQSSQPTLLNNVVTQNYCQNIGSYSSAPLIQGNTVSSSLNPERCATWQFGGIYVNGNLQGSSPAASNGTAALIIGNTIEKNTTGQSGTGGGDGGPGVAVWGGSPVIQGNIIRNNLTRSGSGGAVNVVYGDSVSIVQNLIYGNTAGCGGGAIGSEQGSGYGTTYLLIANNTIVDDVGGTGGGYSDCAKGSEFWTAFYDGGSPTIKIVNNIVHAIRAPGVDCGYLRSAVSEATQQVVDHNLLFLTDGGSFYGQSCFDNSTMHGNMVADPQFVDQANHDFHLKPNSPAIDKGNGSVVAMLKTLSGIDLTKDFDGNVREQDVTGKGWPVIDMGAFEMAGLNNGSATRVVLSSSAYSGAASSNNTLTATLSSAGGVPSGTVNFFMDGQGIGSSVITGGVATLPNVVYKPGGHILYASYDGQGSFPTALSVYITVQIDKYATSITYKGTPNPSLVGQAVTFSVHATSSDSAYIPSPIVLTESVSGVVTVLATLTPDANGDASFTTSTLGLGFHYLVASYAGDATHNAWSGSFSQQVVGGYPSSTSLLSSSNPSTHNDTVTFTARVTSQNGTPTGSVEFKDGVVSLGTVPLDGTGRATLSLSTLSIGSHTITAIYTATGSFATSSGTVQQQVNGLPTRAVLQVIPTALEAGDPVNLTATVVATGGGGVPTGTVTFYSNGTSLGTGTLNAAGVATFVTSSLSAGTDALTCAYNGDSVYASAICAPVSVTVRAAETALALTTSLNPAPALSSVTFTATLTSRGRPAAGAARFLVDGTLQAAGVTNGNGVTTLTLALPTGNHTVRAEFAGTNALLASSAALTQVVTRNATATILRTPPAAVYQNQTVALSAAVTALTGTAQPYGTVALTEGTKVLASQNIAAGQNNAVVNFGAAPLAVGTHTLRALYTPADGNFEASTSATVTIQVLPQTFDLSVATPTLSIQTEHHSSTTLKLTSIGGWTGTARLSCVSPLPPVLSCDMPSSVPLAANGTATVNLTLDTDAVLGFKSSVSPDTAPMWGRRRMMTLACLLLPAVGLGLRRRGHSVRLFGALLMTGALMGLAGCSGKYPDHTPPGTYTIAITATGTAAGADVPTTQTMKMTLTVTP